MHMHMHICKLQADGHPDPDPNVRTCTCKLQADGRRPAACVLLADETDEYEELLGGCAEGAAARAALAKTLAAEGSVTLAKLAVSVKESATVLRHVARKV